MEKWLVLVAFGLVGGDTIHADQAFALAKADQFNTLGIAPLYRNLVHGGTDQHARVGNQHGLVFLDHLYGPDDLAGPFGSIQREHALPTAPAQGVVFHGGALAVTVFGDGQDFALVDDDQSDQGLPLLETDASHTACRAAHGAHIPSPDAQRSEE